MPRWKALPEELDPQVREFASQLRRLVDRSGLSIAAVSDRTGYSKTSWERYLNGRLLAPKGAVVALAEVTNTNPVHLTTMWELAERAWSRSEMRHDMTMEAIRISQARAALGEVGSAPGRAKGRNGSAHGRTPGGPSGPSGAPQGPRGAGAGAGAARPADSPDGSYGSVAARSGPPGPPGPPTAGPQGGGSPDKERQRRKLTMFLAGVVGALVVIAAAVYFTDFGRGDKTPQAQPSTPPPTTSAAPLPAGVKCSGTDCAGQDPEDMGCGGEHATTSARATVGTALIEVRYSKTCGAAWARIQQAAVGDTIEISTSSVKGAKGKQADELTVPGDTYTAMVPAKGATDVKACGTLVTGQKGCTETE
ncbi:helix-turn-helix domain-containing protein [Streptomyces apocyni]|uniref:helix-turn-helix domain-containing protein n=1 Tax=Streptomyces apocyni TaxID=2654677 RepID=UPI0012EA40E5|nr:XRE family transcriptional regulator [Streptomyces apocyni]